MYAFSNCFFKINLRFAIVNKAPGFYICIVYNILLYKHITIYVSILLLMDTFKDAMNILIHAIDSFMWRYPECGPQTVLIQELFVTSPQ